MLERRKTVLRRPHFIPVRSGLKQFSPTKIAIKTSIKRKPQTEKGASEIFTFVLLRGDSVEILLDRNLEKFQSNEARIHVWENLKHDLNSCESFQTFVQRHLKRHRIR